ncbi:EH signature domain-containing protein [uncultured Sphaerotilus sp.]|uniref:EH signature domain-containing protein n=1 Tax=uncultured Sphaerotilus sp. TaxID=474984 RepID=UPI0030CA526A
MNALTRLAAALYHDKKVIDFPVSDSMEKVANSLELQFKAAEKAPESHDLLLQAVKAFWVDSQLHSVRQARLVSYALTLPVHLSGQCLMDDANRFGCLLEGLKRLRNRPLEYRRCYQGLLHSYFGYDTYRDQTSDAGRINWRALRQHLHENHALLNCGRITLDWAHAVAENLHVFGDDPCAPYAKLLLEGNSSVINKLCERLRITKGSWFWRELVIAQIRWSVREKRDVFLKYMPRLLDLLRDNEVLRDKGLTIILGHYASVPHPEINVVLRDAAVEFWGSPWLPSNKARWGGVAIEAKDMISDWLKRDLIKAFFDVLSADGVANQRRVNFWLKYVGSIDNIHFALGSWALDGNNKNMQALLRRMVGLTTELKDGGRHNNAFIMCMGDFVAVEFGGVGNSCYVYDRKSGLPFSLDRRVTVGVNAENSLKNDRRLFKLPHHDGAMESWEERFSVELQRELNVFPDGMRSSIRKSVSPASSRATSDVLMMAKAKGLVIEDLREKNGNLWIKTDSSDLEFGRLLARTGFKYKFGKGWWK